MENYLIYNFKHLRVSWKKLNKTASSIKGLDMGSVNKTLSFIYNKPSIMILKLLKNCFASILHKYGSIGLENIYVVNILTNKGPSLKRFRFVSKGSTRLIKKKFSHLKVILSVKKI